ncbi:MAG: acetate kinase [Clostridia bacterium]|nr:acetate kinase [Clostridia bacterium]
MKVLVVNAGSSSLKYQLLDTETEALLAKGICERIGEAVGLLDHKKYTLEGGEEKEERFKEEIPIPNHSVATRMVVDDLTDPVKGVISDMSEIEAIGHRVVHGGPYFFESTLVTPEVIEKLKLCVDFAPLHTIPHIMGIEGCTAVMPNTPQVLVFDTAFHTTIPEYANTYPLPYEIYEKYHIRRYGAHGTSHRFVSQIMIELLGNKPDSKIITCHIGNGSSISAVRNGKCIDTSMGFTPLDGVEMGTRCGSIDPAIVPYLMEKENIPVSEIANFMNKKCGFLGVSGQYSDSRDIEEGIKRGDKRCLLAASILAYQVKKYIGSYAAAMNGVDAIVFTAGMGENNPELRERALKDMDYYGIEIDLELNAKTWRQPNIVELSTPASKVKVYVIPTNEELMIARDTEAIVTKL